MKKIIILGSSGSIGSYLSKGLSNDFKIIATVRNNSNTNVFSEFKNISCFKVDFANRKDIKNFFEKIQCEKDLYAIINCYGIQGPIGNFKDSNFETWEENLNVNFHNYAFLLHLFLNSKHCIKKVINFSGGGCTFPRQFFSAYSISKISLYKLTETLALEHKDDGIDFNIIAPGSIKSKMTKEIINQGESLGDEYNDAVNTFSTGGQNQEKILDLCNLLLSNKSNGLTGKLISAQWDNFGEEKLEVLKNSKNIFTLRRIDKKFFTEKDTK